MKDYLINTQRMLRTAPRIWMTELSIMLGAYLFGMVLVSVLMLTVVDDNTYAPMGLLFAQLGAVVAAMVIGTRYNADFDMAVKMGATRRGYLPAAFTVSFLEILALTGVLWLLAQFETFFHDTFFSGTVVEMETTGWLGNIGLALSICVLLVGIIALVGALLHRYGRKAFWVVWAVWMLFFIGGPRILDAVESGDNSIFGHLGRFLAGFFDGGFGGMNLLWVLLGGGLVSIVVTVLMLRRASVNQ